MEEMREYNISSVIISRGNCLMSNHVATHALPALFGFSQTGCIKMSTH